MGSHSSSRIFKAELNSKLCHLFILCPSEKMWFPWLPWLPSGVVIVWNIIIAWQSLAQRIQNCWMWCWTPIKPELRQCFHGTNDFLEKSQIVILSWPFVAKEIQTTPEVVAQFLHFVPALRILYVVEIVLSASLMTHYFWCIQSRLFLCCICLMFKLRNMALWPAILLCFLCPALGQSKFKVAQLDSKVMKH